MMRIARCSCGGVELEAIGAPITSVVCYCDDCEEGSLRLAALPNAAPVQDSDIGTAYVLYRADRVRCSRGSGLLQGHRIREKSATSRVVASCCNAAMVMKFDDSRHWLPMYRARLLGDLPPLQWRICTKFKPGNVELPNDVPGSRMYPVGFMVKLLASGVAMKLSRWRSRGVAIT